MVECITASSLTCYYSCVHLQYRSTGNSQLNIFDRGPLDPICYLQMFVGSREAKEAMHLKHVRHMIDRYNAKNLFKLKDFNTVYCVD